MPHTSRRAGKEASHLLRSPKSSRVVKSVAGSDLRQRPRTSSPKKK